MCRYNSLIFVINIRYVGNLDPSVSEDLILALFGQIGATKGCKIIHEVRAATHCLFCHLFLCFSLSVSKHPVLVPKTQIIFDNDFVTLLLIETKNIYMKKYVSRIM